MPYFRNQFYPYPVFFSEGNNWFPMYGSWVSKSDITQKREEKKCWQSKRFKNVKFGERKFLATSLREPNVFLAILIFAK